MATNFYSYVSKTLLESKTSPKTKTRVQKLKKTHVMTYLAFNMHTEMFRNFIYLFIHFLERIAFSLSFAIVKLMCTEVVSVVINVSINSMSDYCVDIIISCSYKNIVRRLSKSYWIFKSYRYGFWNVILVCLIHPRFWLKYHLTSFRIEMK